MYRLPSYEESVQGPGHQQPRTPADSQCHLSLSTTDSIDDRSGISQPSIDDSSGSTSQSSVANNHESEEQSVIAVDRFPESSIIDSSEPAEPLIIANSAFTDTSTSDCEETVEHCEDRAFTEASVTESGPTPLSFTDNRESTEKLGNNDREFYEPSVTDASGLTEPLEIDSDGSTELSTNHCASESSVTDNGETAEPPVIANSAFRDSPTSDCEETVEHCEDRAFTEASVTESGPTPLSFTDNRESTEKLGNNDREFYEPSVTDASGLTEPLEIDSDGSTELSTNHCASESSVTDNGETAEPPVIANSAFTDSPTSDCEETVEHCEDRAFTEASVTESGPTPLSFTDNREPTEKLGNNDREFYEPSVTDASGLTEPAVVPRNSSVSNDRNEPAKHTVLDICGRTEPPVAVSGESTANPASWTAKLLPMSLQLLRAAVLPITAGNVSTEPPLTGFLITDGSVALQCKQQYSPSWQVH